MCHYANMVCDRTCYFPNHIAFNGRCNADNFLVVTQDGFKVIQVMEGAHVGIPSSSIDGKILVKDVLIRI